ncbi:MAG: HNH endonuclease [Proteobacteria bacterium]|nr:HNH endonuclease [Pseudomonadota bacterium]
MRYWWVNQNQTYRHEVDGGYLWSPKRNANGGRNPFYDSMREVSPGDIIFSFAETYVRAIGIAQSYCWESPKPEEFGAAGQNWENIGWRVAVEFHPLPTPVRPKEHMALLAPLLPAKYAPLQANGNGLQSIYLTEISAAFAGALASLLGSQYQILQEAALSVVPRPADDIEQWERKIEGQVAANTALAETERTAIIRARRGQGLFRDRVSKIEQRCRITGVDNPVHLVASHCKPWRDASNEERLDGENGLLLTPSIDHLFDRGFISFEDNGRLLVSPVAQRDSLHRMGVETQSTLNVGSFSQGQRQFLDFHRSSVFLKSGWK